MTNTCCNSEEHENEDDNDRVLTFSARLVYAATACIVRLYVRTTVILMRRVYPFFSH
jgi:hypothetical protein